MKQRCNITLTKEMDEALSRYAYQNRMSRSTIIEEALMQYMSGSDNEIHPLNDDKISVLEERIKVVESKIRNIEKIDNINQAYYQPINKNVTDIIHPDISENSGAIRPVLDSHQHKQKNTDDHAMISLNPEGWYTQTLVAEFLDPSILLSTRKSIVSLAVARGEMETNGKKRKGCRIKGSSAIGWIKSMKRKEKPPIFFLGSS